MSKVKKATDELVIKTPGDRNSMNFHEFPTNLLYMSYMSIKNKRWSSEASSRGFSTSQVFDGLEDLEVRDSQLGMRHFP